MQCAIRVMRTTVTTLPTFCLFILFYSKTAAIDRQRPLTCHATYVREWFISYNSQWLDWYTQYTI